MSQALALYDDVRALLSGIAVDKGEPRLPSRVIAQFTLRTARLVPAEKNARCTQLIAIVVNFHRRGQQELRPLIRQLCDLAARLLGDWAKVKDLFAQLRANAFGEALATTVHEAPAVDARPPPGAKKLGTLIKVPLR